MLVFSKLKNDLLYRNIIAALELAISITLFIVGTRIRSKAD